MSERPVFIVEDFLLVSQTKATVTLCGPLSVVQKLCPIGALVELREAPSDHPTVDPLSNICVDLVRRRMIVPLPISLSEFAANAKLHRLMKLVCGADSIVDARVSERLGAMCVCARGEGDAWLAELPKPEVRDVG